jgi:predicted enzyme related to lactoylglutathione lyase
MKVLFAGVPVADLDTAVEWYERLFDGPPDMAPNEIERCWKLTDESWIYVVVDPERAGRALVTVMVDDLDERVAAVKERGIDAVEVEVISETTRKEIFVDPDGNQFAFGQAG